MSDVTKGKEWDGQTWEEKFRTVTRLYNALCVTAQNLDAKLVEVVDANRKLREENSRLASDLQAASLSLAALGNEINTSNQASIREVMRLRELLKENEIPIGG